MKLPLLSGKQVLAALGRLGFVEVHRRGSHVKMQHPDGRIVVFPSHDEIDRYTLRGSLRDADVDVEEFLRVVCLSSNPLQGKPPRRKQPPKPSRPRWGRSFRLNPKGAADERR